MVRYMADSIDCGNFSPPNVTVPGAGNQPIALTAGYANGSFHNSSQACGPTNVQIDVNGTAPGADVLDIETGDATPSSAPAWVFAHNAHGGTTFPAVLYCNRSNITAIANACANAGLLPGRDFYWWISTLDGTTSVPDMTGVVAIQAWGSGYFGGRNIDLSIVYNDAWKPTFVPPPPITPTHISEENQVLVPAGTNEHISIPCNGLGAFFLAAAFGHTVTVHQMVLVDDTQGAGGGTYSPDPWPNDGVFQSDRPGPVGLPANVRHVVIRYDADHAFTAWCA